MRFSLVSEKQHFIRIIQKNNIPLHHTSIHFGCHGMSISNWNSHLLSPPPPLLHFSLFSSAFNLAYGKTWEYRMQVRDWDWIEKIKRQERDRKICIERGGVIGGREKEKGEWKASGSGRKAFEPQIEYPGSDVEKMKWWWNTDKKIISRNRKSWHLTRISFKRMNEIATIYYIYICVHTNNNMCAANMRARYDRGIRLRNIRHIKNSVDER